MTGDGEGQVRDDEGRVGTSRDDEGQRGTGLGILGRN